MNGMRGWMKFGEIETTALGSGRDLFQGSTLAFSWTKSGNFSLELSV